MKCKRCGSTVDGHFCQVCGAPVENPKEQKQKGKKPHGCLTVLATFFVSVFALWGLGAIMRSANVPEAFPSSQAYQIEMQKENEEETEQPKEENQLNEQPLAEPEEENQPQTEEQPTESAANVEQKESKKPDFGDGNNIEVQEEYVLNTATLKFHHPNCRHVKKIEEENFATCDSREWAISNGYQPCKVCCP